MKAVPAFAIGLGLAGVLGLGCQNVGRTLAMPEIQPPLAELVVPPAFLTPRSQRYRLAVRPFVDQTGEAEGVADTAADVLLTALDARDRFSLYDPRERGAVSLPAVAAPPRSEAARSPGGGSGRADIYDGLRGMVDGVLESYVTAIRADKKGSGHVEVDYRIVDPYSRMVVTSGDVQLGLARGSLVRRDLGKMALDVSRPFIAPGVMAEHELVVREISLDGTEVKLTFDGGSRKQVERGFVGFVVERDRHAKLDRYLAKFVVVSVFREASVGVVVEHCNAVGRCSAGEGILPVEQAQNVHVGSRVRFK